MLLKNRVFLLKTLLLLMFVFTISADTTPVYAHHTGNTVKNYWYVGSSAAVSKENLLPDSTRPNYPTGANGRLVHGFYFSQSMGHPVGYMAYLPPNYDPNNNAHRYPVIYYLHGLNGDETNYFGSGGFNSTSLLLNNEGFVSNVVAAHNSAQSMDTIIIFVNGGSKSYYIDHTGYLDDNGEDHHSASVAVPGNLPVYNYPETAYPYLTPYPKNWPGTITSFRILSRTTIINELIPFIDTHYNTIPSPQGRGIEGFSMGGRGSLILALQHPQTFCSVVAYAPAGLDQIPEEFNPMYGGNYQVATDSASYLVANNPYKSAINSSGMRIRIVSGAKDPNWGKQGLNFASTLRENGFPLTDIESPALIPGVGHNLLQLNTNAGQASFNWHWSCFNQIVDRSVNTNLPSGGSLTLNNALQEDKAVTGANADDAQNGSGDDSSNSGGTTPVGTDGSTNGTGSNPLTDGATEEVPVNSDPKSKVQQFYESFAKFVRKVFRK